MSKLNETPGHGIRTKSGLDGRIQSLVDNKSFETPWGFQ